jgi:coenzyme F420-0:L-glutamate ligase/coenzyme F420-1:gamma-L-glutamate ligase
MGEIGDELRAFALHGLPEIGAGDDLATLIAGAALRAGGLEDGDVVVVAQKAVSKAEGRVIALADVEPSAQAREIALGEGGREDARRIEVILRESARLLRVRPPLVISETSHGFVCASAGVDGSNTGGGATLVLLPLDPDASAAALRERLRELTGRTVGVIVTDSFGRAWRQGTTDVAIGCAGITPLLDLNGRLDSAGYELHATTIAVADEIAGAADLVRGKLGRAPVAVVRGLAVAGEGTAQELIMPAERDLFR